MKLLFRVMFFKLSETAEFHFQAWIFFKYCIEEMLDKNSAIQRRSLSLPQHLKSDSPKLSRKAIYRNSATKSNDQSNKELYRY